MAVSSHWPFISLQNTPICCKFEGNTLYLWQMHVYSSFNIQVWTSFLNNRASSSQVRVFSAVSWMPLWWGYPGSWIVHEVCVADRIVSRNWLGNRGGYGLVSNKNEDLKYSKRLPWDSLSIARATRNMTLSPSQRNTSHILKTDVHGKVTVNTVINQGVRNMILPTSCFFCEISVLIYQLGYTRCLPSVDSFDETSKSMTFASVFICCSSGP